MPLTLAHLCAVFERSGSIPRKPRTLYRKAVRLALEDWDEQRSVKRWSGYADFEVDRKEDFLKAIAYELSTKKRGMASFGRADLKEAYLQIRSG